MKKIILGLCLVMIGALAFSQNGLTRIVVEKYYVSNAADNAYDANLPVGSVTYRFYAEMLPGYVFEAAYGTNSPLHQLLFQTSTTFFNNTDYGTTAPTFSKTNAAKGTVMLDSWLSAGAACAGNFGVLKSEDNGSSNAVNANGILHNTDATAGIPLTTQDGLLAVGGTLPSLQSVTFVGLDAILPVLNDGSANGSTFSTTNGSWASLNGSVGPTSNNRVLIAQLTTDGVLTYKLNLQIGTPTAGVYQNFVAENRTGSEISISSLMGTLGVLPTVSITAPSNGAHIITGDVVSISADASELGGAAISQVEFFVNGTSIGLGSLTTTGTVTTATKNWTSAAGTANITAVATDEYSGVKTSSAVSISVANNQAPTISISSPIDGSSLKTGNSVTITATGSDIDGYVANVQFFNNGTSLGTVTSTGSVTSNPYSFATTVLSGTNRFTAVVTDDRNASGTSSIVTISGVSNTPPTVSITSPSSGAAYMMGNSVSITATASDADGTVSKVEFYVNGSKVGQSTSSPYAYTWTSTIGTKSLTAVATDNDGGQTTSSAVSINVADPNALPYSIAGISSKCTSTMDCIPVTSNDTVKDCIGFDIDIVYDPIKVMPTGFVTIGSDLINPAYASYVSHVISASNTLKVSVYITSNAPAGTTFHGKGKVFCAQFSRTSNFASQDTAVFSVSRLAESYNSGVVTKLVTPGDYTSYKDSIFNGSLKFWADNSPIAYNAANPNQHLVTNILSDNTISPTAPVQPDLSGNFVYNINNGSSVNINRDILSTTDVMSVINGQDALLTKKVLVDDLSFIPNVFQLVAMDVNMDGIVSAGDLSQLSQRTILKISEFKQSWNYDNHGVSNGQNSKDWLFVSSTILNDPSYQISTTYPANDGIGYSKFSVPHVAVSELLPIVNYSTCPTISSETYMGVLLGDVDGNYMNAASSGLLKSNNNNEVVFDLAHAVSGIGYVDVPVSVSSENAVHALDFSLQFNEPKINYESINDLTGINPIAYYNENDKTLRFTSFSMSSYNNNVPVTSIRFSTGSGKIESTDLTSLTAYVNGIPANVKKTESALGITENIKDNSIKVYPNPASSVVNVEVSQNANIQLLDIDGKQILIQSQVNANQKQMIDVQNLANGVYLMKIYNDTFVSMQKVIINK